MTGLNNLAEKCDVQGPSYAVLFAMEFHAQCPGKLDDVHSRHDELGDVHLLSSLQSAMTGLDNHAEKSDVQGPAYAVHFARKSHAQGLEGLDDVHSRHDEVRDVQCCHHGPSWSKWGMMTPTGV